MNMSNACDPRNRPGYIPGDLDAFLEPAPATQVSGEEAMRTAVLAGLSAALIVACVVSIVLLSLY